jgi:hypothetical protein
MFKKIKEICKDHDKMRTIFSFTFITTGAIYIFIGMDVAGWALMVIGYISIATGLICAVIEKVGAEIKLEMCKNMINLLEIERKRTSAFEKLFKGDD